MTKQEEENIDNFEKWGVIWRDKKKGIWGLTKILSKALKYNFRQNPGDSSVIQNSVRHLTINHPLTDNQIDQIESFLKKYLHEKHPRMFPKEDH